MEDAWRVFNKMSSPDWSCGHIGTCEMGARPEGTGTISTKATTETNIPKVVH
jgi:hypothetical protein